VKIIVAIIELRYHFSFFTSVKIIVAIIEIRHQNEKYQPGENGYGL